MHKRELGVIWLLAAAGALILFWWPATRVPFWQDDYDFLLDARHAREASSWHSAFVPEPARAIWRPLGAGVWWRVVEGTLGGNAKAAHVAGLLVLILSAAAVGWLASTVRSVVAPDHDQRLTGMTAGFLYGIHGSHFLPVAWASAANDSLAVLCGALALRFWIAGSTARRGTGAGALSVASLFLVVALLSRESAVVLPLLGLLLTFWLRPYRPVSRLAWLFGGGAIVVTVIWWLLRGALTSAPPPAYEPRLGANVARNAASLALFALNTPREAMRFMLTDPTIGIALWGLGCVIAQAGAVVLLVREARSRLDRRGAAILAAFFLVACSPFVFLTWNSYEYYVSVGLMAFAILAALAARRSVTMAAAVVLAVVSSGLFTAGNYTLDYPALIARANWGERQLRLLESWRVAEPRLAAGPLFVRIEDAQKFQAVGAAGLAYRLGVDPKMIVPVGLTDPAPAGRVLVVFPATGDVYLVR